MLEYRLFSNTEVCSYVRRYTKKNHKHSEHDLLASFTLEHPDELPPEACGTPDFPVLPTRTAPDPAVAAAIPGTPGGSANELVLGRPMPLISL